VVLEDPIERRYVVRETKVRVDQVRFRGRVVPAYSSQCSICTLKELLLLDAAHIVGDVEDLGEPTVQNGLSLCAVHTERPRRRTTQFTSHAVYSRTRTARCSTSSRSHTKCLCTRPSVSPTGRTATASRPGFARYLEAAS
jgi:hypothetical protein